MRQTFLGILIGLISIFHSTAHAQDTSDCKFSNSTFSVGEELTYILSYNWFVVFSEVGLVRFTLKEDEKFGQEAYHFVGEGRTFNWWDKIFKVRDKYETWVRKDNLRPIFFQRNTREGNWRQQESYIFDGDSLIYRKSKVKEDPVKYDTIPSNSCTWDIMSSLLYTRNFDFSNYEIGEKIPVSIALDEKVYDLYFRYLGLENQKVKGVGTFECMKFAVMLVEGTMFHEGENMEIWVTNDQNQLPIYIESPILIGNVKARLISVKGNRFPLTSKKK